MDIIKYKISKESYLNISKVCLRKDCKFYKLYYKKIYQNYLEILVNKIIKNRIPFSQS